MLTSIARSSLRCRTVAAPSLAISRGRIGVRTAARRPHASAAAPSVGAGGTGGVLRSPNFALGVGGGLLIAGLHSATGSANDFYSYRFKTTKDADDLASFYGGDVFMDLFSVFPIVSWLMMRTAHLDEEGNYTTYGFPGQLVVKMNFTYDMDEESGVTDCFNKRERFRDTLFGCTCWEMVTNVGFRTLEDGTIECYHHGEYFHGNMPVVSQVMVLALKAHARWVAWATEHHINHYAFTEDGEEAEEMEEKSRENMPLFLIQNYAWSDLKAVFFGSEDDASTKKQPSFLVVKGGDDGMSQEEETEDDKLPFQKKAFQIQISENIELDKMAMKEIIAESGARSAGDVEAALVRRHTIQQRHTTRKGLRIPGETVQEGESQDDSSATAGAYAMANDLALEKAQMRRMTRQRTMRPNQNKADN